MASKYQVIKNWRVYKKALWRWGTPPGAWSAGDRPQHSREGGIRTPTPLQTYQQGRPGRRKSRVSLHCAGSSSDCQLSWAVASWLCQLRPPPWETQKLRWKLDAGQKPAGEMLCHLGWLWPRTPALTSPSALSHTMQTRGAATSYLGHCTPWPQSTKGLQPVFLHRGMHPAISAPVLKHHLRPQG